MDVARERLNKYVSLGQMIRLNLLNNCVSRHHSYKSLSAEVQMLKRSQKSSAHVCFCPDK